jgi:predicted ATPase
LAILGRVILNGFKSIKAMDLELRPLNILIGANGAGKSNLVSFFKMLNEMMAGRLQQYIGTTGRAQSLLHFGPKVTPQMEAQLEFEGNNGVATYAMRLSHAAGDTLVFAGETLSFHQAGFPDPKTVFLGAGYPETRIGEEPIVGPFRGPPIPGSPSSLIRMSEEWKGAEQTAKELRHLLNQCRVYHFLDTSPAARVRQYSYIGDNRCLKSDAGNLAAFLRRLRDENGSVYQRILSTIRLIAPFFDHFVLDETGTGTGSGPDVILNWRDKGSDQVFGPHQLSDGTLRAICLITLLMQPENELPNLIIVDEPELGLHPYALNVIAALFKKASHHTQVLISTQSSSFLDHFDAEDVIVVNREGKESQFIRPDPQQLETWLDEYSLGEVWEKNVIGGGPH